MTSKIIHIVSSKQLGGLERRLEVLDSGTCDESVDGYSVEYLNICSEVLHKTSIPPTKIISLPDEIKVNGFFSLKSFLWLYFFFKKHKYDVVHAHDVKAIINSIPAAFFARCGVRVSEFVGLTSYSVKARLAIYPSLFLSTNILGISKLGKENLIRSFPLVKRHISHINNPVVLRNYNKNVSENKKKDVFRICFVGRLEPVKNPILLLDVFYDFLRTSPNAELWIVGDGSLQLDIETLINELGIQDSVFLFGNKENPEQYVSKCDVYIQTSESEGFGIAVVEAMLLEVPVIISDMIGASYLVENGINGWVVSSYNKQSFLSCLTEAYSLDPKQLLELGQNSRKIASDQFSSDKYLEKLNSLYFDSSA